MSIKTIDEPAAPRRRAASTSTFFKGHIREYGMLIALVVIMAFFQIMTGGPTAS